MSSYNYLRFDVFTEQPLAGNQLAVFASADGLQPDTMQRIANELCLPETTFVLRPTSDASAFRVRIFTPDRELPMAGHPTVGTAFALAYLKQIRPSAAKVSFELGIGPTPVMLDWESDQLASAWMAQPAPEFGKSFGNPDSVAQALRIDPSLICTPELPIQIVSAGVPFLFVPLTSRAAVDEVILDRPRLIEACNEHGVEELPVYVFTRQRGGDAATTYSRMFAPIFQIPEDPATGGASGPLAAYLARYCNVLTKGGNQLLNLQGVRMRRPSKIYMKSSADASTQGSMLVGGRAVLVGEGQLYC